MELEYRFLEEEVFNLIKDKKIMVLATCEGDRVTARSMSCVFIDGRIYFQTDRDFVKYQQIIKNPKVAFAMDNIQIEGVAKVKGHPFDECNHLFKEAFKVVHSGSYKKYSHMGNEVVIQVAPTFVTLWKYDNGQSFRDFLDLKNKKAIRELYDNTR